MLIELITNDLHSEMWSQNNFERICHQVQQSCEIQTITNLIYNSPATSYINIYKFMGWFLQEFKDSAIALLAAPPYSKSASEQEAVRYKVLQLYSHAE